MADIYLSFLSAPSAAALAPTATLHYITTTTSITEPAAIIKHLQAQDKLVKKKDETIISTLSSGDGVVVETETTYEFVRGGGAILPQMDDNMLVDSVVTVPMVHVVQLDSQGKISQIRMHWDQASMLKQVDAIGRTGRNWPIRDGKAMTNLIKKSVASANSGGAFSDARNKSDEVVITSMPQSSKGGEENDFHTRLFATGEGAENGSSRNGDPSVGVRNSAKPAPRQWGELFPSGPSPDKVEGAKPKAGSSKNFGQNRLFDENTPLEQSPSPSRKKADPSKFNHFEFGNGEEAPPQDGNRPPSASAKKHMSNWDFADFTTPPKYKTKPLREQERHFGHGIDEDEPPSPVKRPIVHAPRRDADPHFALTDVPSPDPQRQAPKNVRPDALASHLKTENNVLTTDQKQPLNNITNSSGVRRGPDIHTHYTSTDASPGVSNDENARVDDPRQGGRNTKSQSRTANEKANWRFDETPEKMKKIYKTAGDGMGGRKDADRSWMTGEDEAPPKEAKIYKTYGNGMGGRRDAAPTWSWGDRDEEVEAQSKDRKIYKTAGDGMGSRKVGDFSNEDDDADFR